MKCLQKLLIISLAIFMISVTVVPTFAAGYLNTNHIHCVEVIEGTEHSEINYTDQREDGTYYISESIKGNTIDSKIYKIENGDNKLKSTIVSEIRDGKIFCVETNVNGEIDRYQVSTNKYQVTDQNNERFEKQIQPSVTTKSRKYHRTEKYGISLVGKKVTIAIAAGAIVAATSYVSLPAAIKIITSAISEGAATGVTALPDYLYVTSNIYTNHAVGKMYTVYENSYYLDSARTNYVGSWTFSKRWGH